MRSRPAFASRQWGEGQQEERFVLREESVPYNAGFDPEKGHLSSENSYYFGF